LKQISSILFILNTAVFLTASFCGAALSAEENEVSISNSGSISATATRTEFAKEWSSESLLLAAGEDKTDANHSAGSAAKLNAKSVNATVASSGKSSISKSESIAVSKGSADASKGGTDAAKKAVDSTKSSKNSTVSSTTTVKDSKSTAKVTSDSAKVQKEVEKSANAAANNSKEQKKALVDPAKSLKDALKGASEQNKALKDSGKTTVDLQKNSKDSGKGTDSRGVKDAAKGSPDSGKAAKDAAKGSSESVNNAKDADKSSKEKTKESNKSVHEHKKSVETIRPMLVPPPPPSVPTMSEMPGMGGPTMIFVGENLDYMPLADLRELKTKTDRDILRAKEKLEDLSSAAAEKQQKAVSFDQLFAEGVISRRELEASKHDDVRADQDLADAKQALSMLEQKRRKIDQRLELLNKPKKTAKPALKRSHH
jgi:hypothetical protein